MSRSQAKGNSNERERGEAEEQAEGQWLAQGQLGVSWGLARGTSYRFGEVMVYRGLALADIQSSAAAAAKTQVLCDVDV